MTGQSGFDFDGTAIYTCGEIYLNGEKQKEIVNSMPEGGGLNGGPQDGGPAPGGQGQTKKDSIQLDCYLFYLVISVYLILGK